MSYVVRATIKRDTGPVQSNRTMENRFGPFPLSQDATECVKILAARTDVLDAWIEYVKNGTKETSQ